MKTISNVQIEAKSYLNIIDKSGQVEITFEPEAEDHAPDWDDAEEFIENVLKNDNELDYCGVSHNWFCAKVTVKHLRTGFEATDYLGGCSYESYDNFVKQPNDYFVDMVNQCIDEINEQIAAINAKTKENWKMRRELLNNGLYEYFLYNLRSIKQY